MTTNLTRDEAREGDKLCEVCVEFFRPNAHSFVADAQGEPLVFSCSCHGMALTFAGQWARSRWPGGEKERSAHRASTLNAGDGHVECVPVCCDFLPDAPRTWAPRRHHQPHLGFDRATHDPMLRRYKQHLSVLMQTGVSCGSASSASVAAAPGPVLQWVLDTECCCHDVHKSLRWSLHLAFQGLDLLRGMYIAVAALRNSYGQLHHHLPDSFFLMVKFVNPEECVPPDELTAVYQALCVEADVVETVAGMSLIFMDGCLECLRHGLSVTT